MPKKKNENVIGAWAFLAGVVLAVIVGLLAINPTVGNWAIALVLIGIVIGLLNVSEKQTKEFMLAGTVLVIVSYFGGEGLEAVAYLNEMLTALVVLFAPATIVAALKTVFAIANK